MKKFKVGQTFITTVGTLLRIDSIPPNLPILIHYTLWWSYGGTTTSSCTTKQISSWLKLFKGFEITTEKGKMIASLWIK